MNLHRIGLQLHVQTLVSSYNVEQYFPESVTKRKRLSGYDEVAFQALHEAITKHGRNIKNSKHFPSNRKIVDDEHWFNAFKLRRSNDEAKQDAIRKSFNRARGKLQEYDYIREYENKIWCIDEPDGQDK